MHLGYIIDLRCFVTNSNMLYFTRFSIKLYSKNSEFTKNGFILHHCRPELTLLCCIILRPSVFSAVWNVEWSMRNVDWDECWMINDNGDSVNLPPWIPSPSLVEEIPHGDCFTGSTLVSTLLGFNTFCVSCSTHILTYLLQQSHTQHPFHSTISLSTISLSTISLSTISLSTIF